MTDTPQPVIDMDAILARFREWEARAAHLLPDNKARLFAVLASAGITRVIVTFDGGGDSGQIEDIAPFRADEQVEMPVGTVEVMMLDHGADQPVANNLSPGEAI